MTIDFGNGYRIVTADSMNYRLQRRLPEREHKGKKVAAGWYDTGNYFQRIGAAAQFVYEAALRDKDADTDVAGALGLMAEEAERIKAAIGAAA